MTTFPGSPRLLTGALVSVDPDTARLRVIPFQYNPDTMTRQLEPRAMGGEGGDKTEVYRLTGPPRETITLKIEIDAADGLEQGDPRAASTGITPALSALELLLYPQSGTVIANAALAQAGNIEIIPPEAPLTLFVWGLNRVLPVRITSFSVTEQAYDPALNPIRAEVDLSLQVLSYADFQHAHPGYSLFMAHQIAKESLGATYVTSSTEILGTSFKIL